MNKNVYRKKNNDISYDKLRLHSSERNSDFHKDIFDKFINNLSQNDIHYYPNLENIYSKLSSFYNTENLIIGNGSDRCIEHFFQINQNKKLLITNPTFPMYNVYGKLYNCDISIIDYTDLIFPITDYVTNITKDSVCVISNPSSPIGDVISRQDIIHILEYGVPTLIDEAYIEFSNESSIIDLIPKYDNLFVTRTFSKAFGSAGVRFGVITSQKQNIDNMNQYRPMFEMNNLTIRWIETLMDNIDDVYNYIENVKNVKKQIVKRCKKLNYKVIDSYCNWVHVNGINNLPQNIIFKENCKIPNMGNNWLRLQITDKIDDYDWLK